MKTLNYKIVLSITMAHGAFNANAAGPNFTDDLTILTANPDIHFRDTDLGEAYWEFCVDNGCTNGVNEAFNIVSYDPDTGGTRRNPIVIQNTAF